MGGFVEVCEHGNRGGTDCPECHDAALVPLLEEVEAALRRFVVLRADALAIVTLWVAHVFAFPSWEFTPYLAVTSAVKRSGKSCLLGILELILGNTRAVSTANISPASLYRLVDASPGTAVLFDEIDRIPKEKAEELWGLDQQRVAAGGEGPPPDGREGRRTQVILDVFAEGTRRDRPTPPGYHRRPLAPRADGTPVTR